MTYGFAELDELLLAYATTIHKSQSSEYPAVVIPLTTQHYVMLQRNLVYTGVTRGKRLVVIVGQRKALAIAVKGARARKRWSNRTVCGGHFEGVLHTLVYLNVYEDLNPATERAYGLNRDQVIGRRLEEVLGMEPAQMPLRHMRACLRTGKNQRYIARRTMAGVTRTIDVMFVLVPERQEDESFIIATAREITEMRQIEDQLHQAQKLEAVGQLNGLRTTSIIC